MRWETILSLENDLTIKSTRSQILNYDALTRESFSNNVCRAHRYFSEFKHSYVKNEKDIYLERFNIYRPH